MLFGRSVGVTYDLATLKHVAEIVLKDNEVLYDVLSSVDSQKLESELVSRGIELSGGFQDLLRYLKINGMTESEIDRFKRDFTEYMITFSEQYLPYEYLRVPAADRAVRAKISSIFRSNENYSMFKVRIDDSAWTQISLDFAESVRKNSCGFQYDPSTNGIISFLVYHAERHYMVSFPRHIMEMLVSTGMNKEIEGTNVGAVDYHAEEFNFKEDYENFNALASNIYKVSDFMYRHNNEVYYDMFSRHKFKKVLEHKNKIDSELYKIFRYANLYTPVEAFDRNFIVKRGRSVDADKYAKAKLEERDLILSKIDPLIEGKASLEDLSTIINDMMVINKDIIDRTGGKDKKPVFDWGWYQSKDKLSNDEKLNFIYKAAMSLKQFLAYLTKNEINVFSVPSAIFRDEKIIRRFNSFERYMNLLEVTEELLAEEQVNMNFVSNDDLYDDLIKNSGNVVNNIPLRSIRDVIDSRILIKDKVKENEFYNELDEGILIRAQRLLSLFFTITEENNLATIYASEYRSVSVYKDFFLKNKILEYHNGYWTVNPLQKLESILTGAYKGDIPRVRRSMAIANSFGSTEEDKFLSYFRGFGFIDKFLQYVSDVLKLLLGTPEDRVVATSKFTIFRIVNDNKYLFTMPTDISVYTEIEDFLDRYNFEYYLEKDKDIQYVGPHLVTMYNLMSKIFSELLAYVRSLYTSYLF